MSERVMLFRMTVIFLSPLVPSRVWQPHVSERRSDRDALRVHFAIFIDHISISACTALALHRKICFETRGKLNNLTITFCERERIVVDFSQPRDPPHVASLSSALMFVLPWLSLTVTIVRVGIMALTRAARGFRSRSRSQRRNPVRLRSIVGQRADENAALNQITEDLTDGFHAVHSTILSYRSGTNDSQSKNCGLVIRVIALVECAQRFSRRIPLGPQRMRAQHSGRITPATIGTRSCLCTPGRDAGPYGTFLLGGALVSSLVTRWTSSVEHTNGFRP